LLGYRRAMNKARQELHAMAYRFDEHLGELGPVFS
jgi:hypothetical protein